MLDDQSVKSAQRAQQWCANTGKVVACLGNMVSADSSFVSPTLTAGTEFPSCDCVFS